jgi:hypothetical protein
MWRKMCILDPPLLAKYRMLWLTCRDDDDDDDGGSGVVVKGLKVPEV